MVPSGTSIADRVVEVRGRIAAAAARSGADSTATMKSARAGRSSYVPEAALRGVPDPGAVAMASVFEALAALD